MKRILTLAAALAVANGAAAQIGAVLDEIAAVVGDKIILNSYIEEQRQQLIKQRYFSAKDMRCEILEDQLYTKLLVSQAEIDSVEVTSKDIDMELDHRLAYFIENLGSEQKVEDYFGKPIVELKEELRSNLKDQMVSQRMQSQITGDIKVTPTEVRRFYEALDKDSMPLIPTVYEFQQITRYPKVEEVEVLEVKTRLEEYRERVAKGESFATLAVLYSADLGTAKRGGELGYMGRGELVPEFANVAFKLAKGEVSRVVKTEYGYHIIQMIDRKGEKVNARHILLIPKIKDDEKERAVAFLDSVRTLISDGAVTFDDAVARFTDDKDSKNGGGFILNMYDNSIRFEQTQVDPRIASAVAGQPEGYVTEPVELEDPSRKMYYALIRVRKKIDTHVINLTDDYTVAQEMALNDKKEKYIGEWIEQHRGAFYIRVAERYQGCPFQYKWIAD